MDHVHALHAALAVRVVNTVDALYCSIGIICHTSMYMLHAVLSCFYFLCHQCCIVFGLCVLNVCGYINCLVYNN